MASTVSQDTISKSAKSATRSSTADVGRLGRITGVQILGTGSYVPEHIVDNADLAEHGYDADWIVQRTGIRQRRRAADDEATSDLAYQAALRCLDQAGADADEVDLVLVATLTPDSPMPSTACLLQHRLANTTAPAMDINAACAGFMYALVTGMQFIQSGCSKRVLVVGADIMSRVVDPADEKTFPLFGDGAGAVLLGAGSDEQGAVSYTLGADGAGAELLNIPAGGSRTPICSADITNQRFIHMDGRSVFKWAVRMLSDSVRKVMEDADVAPSEIDLVVFHQANIRIIDSALNDLGLDRDKVVLNLDSYGNTSAASMPLALDEANQAGRIRPGSRILMCGFGAGLAWGASVLQW